MHVTIHDAKQVGKFTLGYGYRCIDTKSGNGYYSQLYPIIITPKGRTFGHVGGAIETTYDADYTPVDICDVATEMLGWLMDDIENTLRNNILLNRDEWVEFFEPVEHWEP